MSVAFPFENVKVFIHEISFLLQRRDKGKYKKNVNAQDVQLFNCFKDMVCIVITYWQINNIPTFLRGFTIIINFLPSLRVFLVLRIYLHMHGFPHRGKREQDKEH